MSADQSIVFALAARERVWLVARRVCTPAEIAALETRERLAIAGVDCGYRSVATALGIAWTTARDRIRRAEARVERALSEAS